MCLSNASTESKCNIRSALLTNLAKLLIQDSEFVPRANHVFIKLLNVFWSLSMEWGRHEGIQKQHYEEFHSMLIHKGVTYFWPMHHDKISDREIFVTSTFSLQLQPMHTTCTHHTILMLAKHVQSTTYHVALPTASTTNIWQAHSNAVLMWHLYLLSEWGHQ